VRVSVVVCTYAADRFEDCREAVESVRAGSYDDVEVVLVVDGDPDLADRFRTAYDDATDVVVHCNEENRGLSASRNEGVDRAAGDVVAFLDDDAVAAKDWIEELVAVYETHDAIAVGGRMAPRWVAGEPAFLPAEYYWLVGVTHRGFAEPGAEVRNTFGSNISFRRDVLEGLGGFAESIGRQGAAQLQAEEPELCTRMIQQYGQGVIYTPEAVVEHKVFAYRIRRRWLANRAFWQGYSKRGLQVLLPDVGVGAESDYLRAICFEYAPGRCLNLLRRPSIARARQLFWLVAFTALVGAGYVYGIVRWR
jgi:glycosyltransferase involved in cell wall biosynthesis